MTASVVKLPVIRPMKRKLDFLEQMDRELTARLREKFTAPHRTRPLVVINNDRKVAVSRGTDSRLSRPADASRQSKLLPLSDISTGQK